MSKGLIVSRVIRYGDNSRDDEITTHHLKNFRIPKTTIPRPPLQPLVQPLKHTCHLETHPHNLNPGKPADLGTSYRPISHLYSAVKVHQPLHRSQPLAHNIALGFNKPLHLHRTSWQSLFRGFKHDKPHHERVELWFLCVHDEI